VTLSFSVMTRWLRDSAGGRPALEWLQLAVPLPAWILLLASLVPFSILRPLVDPQPGGGLWLFGVALVGFLAISAWGVWGPDRGAPDGARLAILDLRLALGTRVAIQGFFLTALVVMGVAWQLPVLLATALVLLAAEWPLGRLVHARHLDPHAASREPSSGSEQAAAPGYR
jgi:hypothetical protein